MYKPPAATCQPRVAYTPPAAHSSALAPNPAKVTPAKISTLEIGTGAKKGGSATSAPLPAGNVLNGETAVFTWQQYSPTEIFGAILKANIM